MFDFWWQIIKRIRRKLKSSYHIHVIVKWHVEWQAFDLFFFSSKWRKYRFQPKTNNNAWNLYRKEEAKARTSSASKSYKVSNRYIVYGVQHIFKHCKIVIYEETKFLIYKMTRHVLPSQSETAKVRKDRHAMRIIEE